MSDGIEAGCPPERMLMVATRAWGLRGAQAGSLEHLGDDLTSR